MSDHEHWPPEQAKECPICKERRRVERFKNYRPDPTCDPSCNFPYGDHNRNCLNWE